MFKTITGCPGVFWTGTYHAVYRERSETISGNNQASQASVIAMYSHCRLVLGGTRSAYGPTTDARASTTNQKVDDLSMS
jgi:hypothetical protein